MFKQESKSKGGQEMKYKTIYGELVEGKVIQLLEHTVVIETTNEDRYLVHKRDYDPTYTREFQFDLGRCQRVGRQLGAQRLRQEVTSW